MTSLKPSFNINFFMGGWGGGGGGEGKEVRIINFLGRNFFFWWVGQVNVPGDWFFQTGMKNCFLG